MIKEWATVVAWQQGVATLRCEPRSGCGSCQSRSGCGARALSEPGDLAPASLFQIPYARPLSVGQRVELGIGEGSLLRSALLIYMTPLAGLLSGAALMQALSGSEIMAVCGAFAGGALGFMLARLQAGKMEQNSDYQPTILQVALPDAQLRVQTASEQRG
ncbi:SoxR-reducing system protein RseC [Affinibrenneria salicis]|uniref:SoxR-reducing system protein RseC n=1 Tax=Affinibrenneria salicis TaxID=2590031 RepID=A0A5J5FR15_9GAMM|nr:SoxR-reducing system protein RseC [Affinibrenneria salicis]KAA8995521.1 SoxR-reducing system protein RseC [Affinibrenneria salicis]